MQKRTQRRRNRLAKERGGQIIFAEDAEIRTDYFCIECGGKLRVRGGFYREQHFFHYERNSLCKQNYKTDEHIATQERLLETLPGSVAEHPFAEIGRIADIFWESQKLVFEVQVSPITWQEVKERNQDYASLGLQVIWIFHELYFNRFRMKAVEHFNRQWPSYFSDIRSDGTGRIYDQHALCLKGRRLWRGPKLEVDLSCLAPANWRGRARSLANRRKKQTFAFQGDYYHNSYDAVIDQAESKFLPPVEGWAQWLWRYLRSFYLQPFRIILEKVLDRK